MSLHKPSAAWIDAVCEAHALSPATITPISTGWDFAVFDLDGDWMVRVARHDVTAGRMETEARLLRELAPSVPFAVPVPVTLGMLEGYHYTIYAKVEGRPLRAGDDAAAVGAALARLHAFPADEARALLGIEGAMAAWVGEYKALWRTIEASVLPLLPGDLAAQVQERYHAVLDETAWHVIEPVLVHRDLGAEHIRMSEDGSRVRGIIDFGDATVGDPAIDFVGVRITLGASALEAAMRSYGAEIDRRRIDFYYWLGPIHEILYGLWLPGQSFVDAGINGLKVRLAEISG